MSPQTMEAKRKRAPMNGVDTPTLFATINAVAAHPKLAQFRFRASNRWIEGTHSLGRIETFFGACGEQRHARAFEYDADHPPVLVGKDEGPTPVEFLLQALLACLTAGIGNIAAARGVRLTRVESRVEGDIDLRGSLGISSDVRNGYQQIRVSFDIDGDASQDELRAIVEQSKARSAVFDVLTNGVPVEVRVNVG